MVTIVDRLILGPEELSLLFERYPNCNARSVGRRPQGFEEYRVVIEEHAEQDYYNFLVDNVIAMSSFNFYSKLRSDRAFARQMKARISEPL